MHKTLAGVAVAALTFGAAFAASSLSNTVPARAADANTVSATWTLGQKVYKDVAAEVSDASVITASNLTFGSTITSNRVRTAKPSTGEVKLTTYNTVVSATPDEDEGYVAFTLTTAEDFKVTNIAFDCGAIKTGNARMDVVLEGGSQPLTVATAIIPARVEEDATKDATIKLHRSFEVEGAEAIAGDIAVKCYLYGDAGKAREIGFANVVITGTVEGGETPADEYFFHIPGTLPVPDTKDEVNYTWGGNAGIEGNDGDKNFCGFYEGATLTFNNVHVHQAGAYTVTMPLDWSTGSGTSVIIEVTDATSGKLEAKCKTVMPKNNSKWELIDFPLEGRIEDGVKNVKFAFELAADRNFACNFKAPIFTRTGEGSPLGGDDDVEVPDGWMTMPGTIDIDHASWSYDGLKVEGGGANIGYAKNGCSMTGNVFVKEQGVYNLHVNFNWFSNPGDFRIEITDQTTGVKEIDTYYTITGKHVADILLEGVLTPGKKTIKYSFVSDHNSFIANFIDHEATKVADKYAAVTGITVDAAEAVDYEGFDYNFNLPANYSGETVALKVAYSGGSLAATMGETALTVAADGTIAVPTPEANGAAELKVTLTPEEGAVTNKAEYNVRLYRLGDIIMTALTLDGVAAGEGVLSALNSEESAAVDGMVFTSVPAVVASFIDGTSVTAELVETTPENNMVYSVTATSGTLSKVYILTVSGLHAFVPAQSDKTAELKFDSACKGADGIWTNGLYSITCNDGWDGKQFKMKGNATTTLTAPSDMKIRQLTLRCLRDNYTPGRVASVASGDATVWCPTPSQFQTGINDDQALNLVVNFENHTPGTPIEITFEGGSQPVAWFEFIYEEVAPTTAPTLVSTAATSVADRNHAVVKFTFDREMTATTITVNGTEVSAEGGSAVLAFSIWDLPFNTDVDVTIPAGAAADKYGNRTAAAATLTLEVGAPAVVEPIAADRFIEVSNVAELRAAVDGLNNTNKTADAARTIIYVLNGDYDLGSTALNICNFYNVALVGESQDGVLIHGLQTGISYPVLSTRYSTNVYMENFTLRNDLDFGKAERAGVGAAHYGGNLDIFKNVTLQSIQDTEVSGERGYWYNVTIHGSVDYICGGGDHFFDNCLIKHEIAGGYIVAPSTSPSKKYGYVFSNCTIDGVGPYDLGRPWQNEPRTFFVNTTMKVLPNETGWGRMGNLITHFYEYNSMDANGNALDLSKRRNSPTSLNTYTPILTDEQAAHLTLRNVLGGTDSWDAAEMVAELPAPAVTLADDGTISWQPVEGAAGYLVYADGAYVGMTTGTTFDGTMTRAAAPAYTVAAFNANGARGKVSERATTGIAAIEAENGDSAQYFNLQGIRVADDARGILIRVTRNADGSVTTEKIAR